MIRHVLAVLAALCALLFLGAAPAAADTTADAPPVLAFTIAPAGVVQLLVAFLLPVLVGLVTTRVTSAARKAWLLAGLTLISALLVELGRSLQAEQTFDVGVALLTALPAFVVSVASHYGLWKPTGVADAAQRVGAPRDGGSALGIVRH